MAWFGSKGSFNLHKDHAFNTSKLYLTTLVIIIWLPKNIYIKKKIVSSNCVEGSLECNWGWWEISYCHWGHISGIIIVFFYYYLWLSTATQIIWIEVLWNLWGAFFLKKFINNWELSFCLQWFLRDLTGMLGGILFTFYQVYCCILLWLHPFCFSGLWGLS